MIELDCRITQLTRGEEVNLLLGRVEDDGQMRFLDAEAFGPFDTALDVTRWLVKRLAPELRLPLR